MLEKMQSLKDKLRLKANEEEIAKIAEDLEDSEEDNKIKKVVKNKKK